MGYSAFFIGDVAMDEYYRAPYFPKIKEKILVQTLPPQMGGMIANAACVYAAYDQNAAFLAALNPGPLSQRLCEGLKTGGLDIRHMVWDANLPDAKTIVILAENEHTVFIPTMNLQSFPLDEAAFAAIGASRFLYSTFCELRPMHYQDMGAAETLAALKRAGCQVWCDLDVADLDKRDAALFPYADVLFVNEKGMDNLRRRFGGDAAHSLFSMGVQLLIETRAENGCVLYTADHPPLIIAGIPVPVVDVTGAGDTFCASFLYARTKTNDLCRCAEFANYAAARSVTGMGARFGAAGLGAVVRFIAEHGGDATRFAALGNKEDFQ